MGDCAQPVAAREQIVERAAATPQQRLQRTMADDDRGTGYEAS
jgi:hypothetical protein